MDGWPNEMHPIDSALIVKRFKFVLELTKILVGTLEHGCGDVVLVEDAYGSDEFAEVSPVFLREKVVKKSRTKSKDVDKVFPSLVTTRNLLCRIARWAVK